jgi:hypothetical protein
MNGEAHDPADRLGVEQQADGDSAAQRRVGGRENVAQQLDPASTGERGRVAGLDRWQREPPGEFGVRAPQQEGANTDTVVLAVLGVPGIDLGLPAVGQFQTALGEPGEERGGAVDLLSGEAAAGRPSRSSASRSERVQRVQSRSACSLPSCPQREQA